MTKGFCAYLTPIGFGFLGSLVNKISHSSFELRGKTYMICIYYEKLLIYNHKFYLLYERYSHYRPWYSQSLSYVNLKNPHSSHIPNEKVLDVDVEGLVS